VRQLTDVAGAVTLAKTYQPFGNVMQSVGTSSSLYGFTNEWTDGNGLVYLRARYYVPEMGRFITKDLWPGDSFQPSSLNGWNYVEGNPINRVDPHGMWYCQSGLFPQTSECRTWVTRALDKLETSGTTGKKLVNFFNFRDTALSVLDYAFCRPVPIPSGIKIIFEPYITGWREAYAIAIWPNQIFINSSFQGYSGSTPSPKAVVTFGHEISHLAQGGFLSSLSYHAEVLASIVGYYLEIEQDTVHGDDGSFIINNRLDPWSTTDLKKYDEYYWKSYNKRLPYLIWGTDGLSRNWLGNWSITLPYPISSKPKPEPVPTPPPGIPSTPTPEDLTRAQK
jgi:RHS repeat-associated protein